jgi:hypothetical protein
MHPRSFHSLLAAVTLLIAASEKAVGYELSVLSGNATTSAGGIGAKSGVTGLSVGHTVVKKNSVLDFYVGGVFNKMMLGSKDLQGEVISAALRVGLPLLLDNDYMFGVGAELYPYNRYLHDKSGIRSINEEPYQFKETLFCNWGFGAGTRLVFNYRVDWVKFLKQRKPFLSLSWVYQNSFYESSLLTTEVRPADQQTASYSWGSPLKVSYNNLLYYAEIGFGFTSK